jgi:hypothetical protein
MKCLALFDLRGVMTRILLSTVTIMRTSNATYLYICYKIKHNSPPTFSAWLYVFMLLIYSGLASHTILTNFVIFPGFGYELRWPLHGIMPSSSESSLRML